MNNFGRFQLFKTIIVYRISIVYLLTTLFVAIVSYGGEILSKTDTPTQPQQGYQMMLQLVGYFTKMYTSYQIILCKIMI
jgi:hypothetical protein